MSQEFENMDRALPTMAARVMNGNEVGSRLGERTMELLHQQIELDKPWQREILAPSRSANVAAQIAETMWVLAGRDDVEFLSHYLPRAGDFSDDGEVWRGAYGPRLRAWPQDEDIDQIRHIVDLLADDRSSRRAVVSIYDPAIDTEPGKDIPCNDFLSFISRNGRLDLSVFVRSNDLVWGWSGINAFEWSTLQEIVAGILGLNVGHLVFNTTSLHVYDRHWERARKIAENGRYAPLGFQDSPRFSVNAINNAPNVPRHPIDALDEVIGRWFDIEQRLREGGYLLTEGPQIVTAFPEPMMRSWLQVIGWYWTGDEAYIKPLEGTRLWAAVQQLPQSIQAQVGERALRTNTYAMGGQISRPLAHKTKFVDEVDALHREKSAAYGDSWKKRGELFSIIPNIARKIDRLETGGSTTDETSADTAIDLLVYITKYRLWLSSQDTTLAVPPFFIQNPDLENEWVRGVLEHLDAVTEPMVFGPAEAKAAILIREFENLQNVVSKDPMLEVAMPRAVIVNGMLKEAFMLARLLWEKENGHPTVDFQNPYRNIP